MKENDIWAFPHEYTELEGMTLRDWFAGMALPAVIAAYDEANKPCIGSEHILRNCPVIAYKIANAMIEERAK